MVTNHTLSRVLCHAILPVFCLSVNFSCAQGDSCTNPLQANFCPQQVFDLSDSLFTDDVSDWGIALMSQTPGKDIFFELNFPNDTAVSRQIRCSIETPYLSHTSKIYLLWFEDTCGAAPIEVDSFELSSLPNCGRQVCYTHLITNVNASEYRLAVDFSDSVDFNMILSLGYTAIHADTACEDSFLVNTGIMELDNSMCGDSLHLPFDSSMVYLPGNMPVTIFLNDASPNNNGYLVTVKKVSANLGIYNHPFENSSRFSIDTSNQDYCDIIVTLFLKNTTGREAMNALRLQLDDNFDVLQPLIRYGGFFMPSGAGYHHPNGNWSSVYNPPDHEIIWEFQSVDGRGDIDTYAPYSCKAYHFGFRAKVSLTGAPFNLHFSLQGDGWGDSTQAADACGPRKSGCSFKCNCKCMCKPGQSNFIASQSPSLDFLIEGGSCLNNIAHDDEYPACTAQSVSCINVNTNLPVMLYEGFSGLYKVANPVGGLVCADSCSGRITTIDTLACTQEIYFSRTNSISTLAAYDGAEYYLCAGDTIVLSEDDSMPGCIAHCTSCSSNLVDSNQTAVAYSSGKYFITSPGWYYDRHGMGGTPCVAVHVLSTDVEVNITNTTADCFETCHQLSVAGDSSLSYEWYLMDGTLASVGNNFTFCHSDTQSIQLLAGANSSCAISKTVFLEPDSASVPQIYLDTIVAIPCGSGAGLINIHTTYLNTSFIWSDSSSSEDYITGTPGTYSVIASNPLGCADTAVFAISEVAPFSVSVTGIDSVCAGDNVTLCASPVGNYVWSTGETSSCIAVVAEVNSGLRVTVTDAANCAASANFVFAFVDEIRLSSVVIDVPCFTFYSSGAIDLTASNGMQPYIYEWSNQSQEQDLAGLIPGDYAVTVTDELNCSASALYTVAYLDLFHIHALPLLDTIRLGETVLLNVTTTGSSFTRFNWSPSSYLSCDDCFNPVAEPPVPVLYVVTGIDTNQCRDADTVRIVVVADYTLFIPNVFTPNGDGNNDVWQVLGNLEAIQKFDLKLFNRWGEKVFETNDFTQGWDGAYRGEQLVGSVFVYAIKVSWKDGHFDSDYKGSVTLLR